MVPPNTLTSVLYVNACAADTNAPSVKLELNGQPIDGGSAVHVPFFGQATFNVTYAPGNLTTKCMDTSGKTLGSHSVVSLAGPATSMELSLDAPSVSTGTGSHLVADGEDVAMVRATLFDSAGNFAYNSTDNVTYTIISGPGKIWVSLHELPSPTRARLKCLSPAQLSDLKSPVVLPYRWLTCCVPSVQATHNGDPADNSPRNVGWVNAYHGLARAFVRVSMDAASPHWHRSRMLEIDSESGRDGSVDVMGSQAPLASDIVLSASAPGIPAVQLTIPVSTSTSLLPRAVASNAV